MDMRKVQKMKIIKSLEDLKIDDIQFEDKKIVCKDCGQEFTFTVGEQQFFAENNLVEPKRCKACVKARRNKFKK